MMRVLLMRVAVASGLAMALPAQAQPVRGTVPINVTVNVNKTSAPISPLIYGQFTENANANFYRGGLWAELLEDRKFYYPVTATPPANALAAPIRGRFKPYSPWRPIGGDSVVTMDTQRAYSGKQSAKITLDGAAARGIRQSGLATRKGQDYQGRIVLASTPGVDVQVSLVWGSSPAERRTIKVAAPGAEFRPVPFTLTSAADSDDASIEIVATGTGSVHIGAVSLMPADNVGGWRADSLRALREIAPTMIRYGGNFIADYEWSHGVGDRDRRPSTFDFAWEQMDPNDVGTDEILALISLVKAEPYMNVNAGFGDANSAARWLEYVNGAVTTPMGRQRAANGHPEPYKVKWWNIGNEMYGPWQLGQMPIKHYAIKHNRFADAMRQVDPTITIVAVGATPGEMNTTRSSVSYGKSVVDFGSDQDWNSVMLTNAAGNFDYLAEHLYPKGNQAFDAEQGKFVPVEESQADHARRLPNRVKMAVEAWQEYQKRFPALDMKKIKIALDEWVPGNASTPGSPRDPMYTALSSAEALHELIRNSEWFVLANFTHLTGLVTGRTETTILPSGRMFQLYRNHFGTIPVDVSGDSPQREVKGVLNVDKPKVSSGSATYPLDVAAALTSDGKTLTLAVVNPTEGDQQIAVDFKGAKIRGTGTQMRIADPSRESGAGTPGQAAGQRPVTITETALRQVPRVMTIPKRSITMYTLPVR